MKKVISLLHALLLMCSTVTAYALNPLFKRATNIAIPKTIEILDFWTDEDGMQRARWKKQGKDLLIDVKLANTVGVDTIDAVDLAIYCENAYGEALCPTDEYDGSIRYFSLSLKIKPGQSSYSGYCRMEGLRDAVGFYVALTRYHLKDGGTHNFGSESESDPLKRYTWLHWTTD